MIDLPFVLWSLVWQNYVQAFTDQPLLKYLGNSFVVALVATVEREGKEVEVGVVRYIVDPAGNGCEFAIAVDDECGEAWWGLANIKSRSSGQGSHRQIGTISANIFAIHPHH